MKRSSLGCLSVATLLLVSFLLVLIPTASAEPTELILSNFRAEAAGETVKLRWATGSELTLIGFNVWRRTGKDDWKILNPVIIPAKNAGAIGGSTYRLNDRKVRVGKIYRYKLELLKADGTSQWSAVEKVILP